ncbi:MULTISPECIES: hypothetical protein [Providencia]|uniref:hypothetical protein n=1 Tax=Providencia TaxID=586 RepID=UPI001181F8DA|nr:hypothetical protein [Providencia rettgeri]ELR5252193.1 hypothetical protein [Providencia rettgeri]
MDIDRLILASAILFVAVVLFGISKYAIKIRALDDAGGPQAYYDQQIEWPLTQFYIDLIEESGVKPEFDAWVKDKDKPLTLGQFDDGLAKAIQTAYSLPMGKDLPDTQIIKLIVYRHGAPVLKWMSIGCFLLSGVLGLILLNPQNTLAEGIPFIMFTLLLALVFRFLRNKLQGKAQAIVLNRPLTVEQVASLVTLAARLKVHSEFCQLLRSPECPSTVKEAHTWIVDHAKVLVSEHTTFLG